MAAADDLCTNMTSSITTSYQCDAPQSPFQKHTFTHEQEQMIMTCRYYDHEKRDTQSTCAMKMQFNINHLSRQTETAAVVTIVASAASAKARPTHARTHTLIRPLKMQRTLLPVRIIALD